MALAEAIAHGLPVVSTLAGAIPDTVPPGAGLLVPPDDAAALAQALRRVIGDPADRQRLATNARAAAAQLPTWQDSARLFAGAIEAVGRSALIGYALLPSTAAARMPALARTGLAREPGPGTALFKAIHKLLLCAEGETRNSFSGQPLQLS